MDVSIFIFVGGLCLVAFFLTLTIRHELIAKERRRRQDQHQPRHFRSRR